MALPRCWIGKKDAVMGEFSPIETKRAVAEGGKRARLGWSGFVEIEAHNCVVQEVSWKGRTRQKRTPRGVITQKGSSCP
jgi:hypothetical protein